MQITADNFWFSDARWRRIEPHLPMIHTGPCATMMRQGYSAADLRHFLESWGITPIIPNKANPKATLHFNPDLYRFRNFIERTSCRLKGFRTIATHYDKLARNFLAAFRLVAAPSCSIINLECYWPEV
jgi:transposase